MYLAPSLSNRTWWGWPRGRVVKFTCSASVAQGFADLDPGPRHGTAHQAMVRWHPTCHNWKDPQLKYTTTYWGALGRKKKRNRTWSIHQSPSGPLPDHILPSPIQRLALCEFCENHFLILYCSVNMYVWIQNNLLLIVLPFLNII